MKKVLITTNQNDSCFSTNQSVVRDQSDGCVYTNHSEGDEVVLTTVEVVSCCVVVVVERMIPTAHPCDML